MSSDLNTLLAAEQANRQDYHWAVAYSVQVHESLLDNFRKAHPTCEDCGEKHEDAEEIGIIADSVVVAAGDDAWPAVERAKEYVLDERRYGLKVNPATFRLQGVKLLSVREI